MQPRLQATFALLFAVAALYKAPAARAQSPSAVEAHAPVDLALGYSYLRSNAPPGGCGCFSMNGGTASVAIPLKSSPFSVLGDFTSVRGSQISPASYDMALNIFTAGLRFRTAIGRAAWRPFGQVLAGGAHGGGTLIRASLQGKGYGAVAFAFNAGGGMDYRVNRHFGLRLIQADYLLTSFDNHVNDHQNNLSLNAGVVVSFGK
jgi:peptidoglycan-associated lipoprotein